MSDGKAAPACATINFKSGNSSNTPVTIILLTATVVSNQYHYIVHFLLHNVDVERSLNWHLE